MDVNENICLFVSGHSSCNGIISHNITMLLSLWKKYDYTIVTFYSGHDVTDYKGPLSIKLNTKEGESAYKILVEGHAKRPFKRLILVGVVSMDLLNEVLDLTHLEEWLPYIVSDATVIYDIDTSGEFNGFKSITVQQILTLFKCIRD